MFRGVAVVLDISGVRGEDEHASTKRRERVDGIQARAPIAACGHPLRAR